MEALVFIILIGP